VSVFVRVKKSLTADDLKHLGTSLADYVSIGMLHKVCVTPVARTVEEALRDQEPKDAVTVTDENIGSLHTSYHPRDGRANLVVFSKPQLSLYKVKMLSELLEGKRFGKAPL
jgi:predicted aconitase